MLAKITCQLPQNSDRKETTHYVIELLDKISKKFLGYKIVEASNPMLLENCKIELEFFWVTQNKSKKSPNFQCQICYKNFDSKKLLIHHVRQEKMIKPYKCKDCAFYGFTSIEVQRHAVDVHKVETKRADSYCFVDKKKVDEVDRIVGGWMRS